MNRLAAALIVVTTSALAQERTWQEAQEAGVRLYREGQNEAAAAALAEAAGLAERASADPKERAGIEQTLAAILHALGRETDTEAHMRAAVALRAGAVGALDERLAFYRSELAAILADSGKLDEAELVVCTALEAVEGTHLRLEADALTRLVLISFKRREYWTASAFLRRAYERLEKAAEPHDGVIRTRILLAAGKVALEMEAYEDAEGSLRTVLAYPGVPVDEALEATHGLVESRIRQETLLDQAEGLIQEVLDHCGPNAARVPERVGRLSVLRARICMSRGDKDGAAAWLEKAKAAVGTEADFLEARAQLKLGLGETKAALADLAEALTERTREGESGMGAARTLLQIARVHAGAGAHGEALEYARRAIRIYQAEVGTRLLEARAAYAEYDRMRTAAAEAGVTELPPVVRGVRLDEAVEPDFAETDAKVRQLLEKGRDLYKRKDSPHALALYDEAAALRPGEPTVHRGRAIVLVGMDRTEEAIAALDAEILWSVQPDPKAYVLRATLQVKLGRYDRGIVDATYAMLLGEAGPAPLQFRGMARVCRQENELALRSLDTWAAASPDDGRAKYWRALALRNLGDLDRAAAEATRSIEAGAKDLVAYGIRGFIRLDREEWKDALADFEAWAGAEPPSLYGRILQWICRAHMGERAAGDAALRGAVDAEKEHEELRAVARAILGEGPAAPTDGPVPPDQEQRESGCTAHFLLGAWREAEGDRTSAKAHYECAVAMACPDVLEYQSAKAALARLAVAK